MAGVKLKISYTEKSNWVSTISTKGTQYWYKFTGGNTSNNGDQVFEVGKGECVFRVRFNGSNKNDFRFLEFYCFGDGCDQLAGYPVEDNTAFIVIDECTRHIDDTIWGVYVYLAHDPSDVFLCHPRISNQFGPLDD